MKRLISILLIALMLMPATNAGASYTDDGETDRSGLLNALGITDSALNQDAPVTKYEATRIAMKISGRNAADYIYNGEFSDISAEDADASLIGEAVRSGIARTPQPNLFAKNSYITYNAAIELIFNALGFSRFQGGTSGYARLAVKYDLDIKVKNSAAVSFGEFCIMAETALEIPLIEARAVKENNIIYELNENTNALERYFDVYKAEGIVESNGITSLYSTKSCTEGYLGINGMSIKYENDADTNAILGMEVELYYRDEDSPKYVYHRKSENQKILTISSDDIESYSQNTYVYNESEGKTKKIITDSDSAIVYNGKAITGDDTGYLKDELFVPQNGYVELISCGGNYTTVKIYSFETYVVQNVYSGDKFKMITDKYGQKNLLITDDTVINIKNKHNQPLDFDSIETGDVLSVARSVDGKCVMMYACGEAVEGIYKSRLDSKITVEGEDFEMSRQLMENPGRIPPLGENVTVYLDGFGKVVAIEVMPEGLWSIGLLLRVGTEGAGLRKCGAVCILPYGGNLQKFIVAEKVCIDGKWYGEPEKAVGVLKSNEIIRYKLNKSGEVYKADTAIEVESAASIQSAVSGSYTWRNTHSLFYTTEGDVIPVRADAKIFVNPEFVSFAEGGSKAANADFYDDDYFTGGTSLFTDGIVYNIKAYKTNPDSMLADVILCGSYNFDLYLRSGQTYVVNSVVNAIGKNGDEIIKIRCTGLNGEKEIWDYKDRADNVYVNSIRTIKNVKKGDVIRAELANDNRIIFMFKVFDYANREFYQRIYSSNAASVEESGILPKYTGARPNEYNSYSDREYYVYGDAAEFSEGYIRVRPIGGNREIIFKSSDNVIIYEEDNVRRGSMNDVCFDESGEAADKIFIAAYLAGIQTVIVFK